MGEVGGGEGEGCVVSLGYDVIAVYMRFWRERERVSGRAGDGQWAREWASQALAVVGGSADYLARIPSCQALWKTW